MRSVKKEWSDYLIVLIGCFIQAYAVTAILRPNGLIVGGFTGISIVFGKLANMKYTYIYYAICLFVLIATKFVLGKKRSYKNSFFVNNLSVYIDSF